MRIRHKNRFYDNVRDIYVADNGRVLWYRENTGERERGCDLTIGDKGGEAEGKVDFEGEEYNTDSGLIGKEQTDEMRKQMSLVFRKGDFVDLDHLFKNVREYFKNKKEEEEFEDEIERHAEEEAIEKDDEERQEILEERR